MKLMLKNRILDLMARLFRWLALHCECWRFGHRWQLGPNVAWCEHCEARITGERAIRKFGDACRPKPLPRVKWPPIVVDDSIPQDTIYIINLSNLRRTPDGAIWRVDDDNELKEIVVPAFQFPPAHYVEEGGPIFSREQWDLLFGPQ